jgi:hypothetical protein
MGAGESIPRELTHERVFQLTHDTRHVMNLILQYMLKEVTVKDFLALSNPAECKKYVLFMANTLHKYFYELEIQPVKDRRGVIAFRSIRDLVAPSAEADKEKQSLCLVLAYYYTRIFQIYGALALTLIDDITTMRQTGMMPTGGPGQRLMAPGQRPVIYGGAISEAELGRFAFMKDFLLEEKSPNHGYRTKFREQNGLYGEVFFKLTQDLPSGSLDDIMAVSSVSLQKGTFTFSYEGARRLSTIDIKAERVSTDSSSSSSSSLYSSSQKSYGIRITFENLQYAKKSETTMTRADIPSSYMARSLPLIYPITSSNGRVIYAFKDSMKSLNEVLQDTLYRIILFTKTLVEEGRVLNSPSSVGVKVTNGTKPATTADLLSAVSSSEADVVEELRLGVILNNLTQTKPYGHCIARAMQLLDNSPFPDQPAVSHICKAKFLEVSGSSEAGRTVRYSRSGIPEPSKPLTSSPGLFALSLLFYDTIQIGTPKLSISQQPGPNGKSSLQQYTEFMRRMAVYFGDNRSASDSSQIRSNNSLRESGLTGIKNRRDQDLCKDYGGDISISPQVARQVYGVVQSLFKEQLEHSAVCGKIFRMLFDIQREGSTGRIKIALNENILKKGVAEINRINFLARDQLMKYYSNCEAKYVQGVKLVIDSKLKEKAAASKPVPAPSVPPAFAPSAPPLAPSAPPLAPSAPPAPPAPPAASKPQVVAAVNPQFKQVDNFMKQNIRPSAPPAASKPPVFASKASVAAAKNKSVRFAV